MGKQWDQAGDARRRFADMLDGLSSEQAEAGTWCEGWTVRNTAAHVAFLSETSMLKMTTAIAKARMDWNTASNRLAVADTRGLPELVDVIRANATRPLPIPGSPQIGTVADVSVHSQDICRPLGVEHELTESEVRAVFTMLLEERNGSFITPREKLDGLRFVATDLDFAAGDGPTVEGPAVSLALAMAGRPTFDEVSGDGVDTLRSRLGSRH